MWLVAAARGRAGGREHVRAQSRVPSESAAPHAHEDPRPHARHARRGTQGVGANGGLCRHRTRAALGRVRAARREPSQRAADAPRARAPRGSMCLRGSRCAGSCARACAKSCATRCAGQRANEWCGDAPRVWCWRRAHRAPAARATGAAVKELASRGRMPAAMGKVATLPTSTTVVPVRVKSSAHDAVPCQLQLPRSGSVARGAFSECSGRSQLHEAHEAHEAHPLGPRSGKKSRVLGVM